MIDRRLFQLPKIVPTLIGLVVLTGLQAFSVLAQGIFLAWTLTRLWQGQPWQNVVWLFVGFAMSFVLRHLFDVLKNEWMSRYAETAVETYRTQLLAKYADLGPSAIAKMGTGSAVATLGAGLDNVKNYFQLLLIKVFDVSITPWIILAYIAYLNWEQALFLLVIYPVVILFFILLGLAAQKKADAEYANFTNLNNRFVDALRGLPTLKQLGLSRQYANEIYGISEDYRKATMRTLRIAIMSSFALDFFTTLSVAVVAVFLGLALLEGQTVLLPALTILVLAPEYFMPLRNFADDYHATLDGKNALTDVYALLDTPSPQAHNQQQVPRWQANSQLVVENLKVVHEDAQTSPALYDINLTVTGHQKIAIVGTSGAGKTTLMQVLAGFMTPTAGQFRIDQQTTKSLAQPSWQAQFFYMPQKPYIFHASLRDNIRFYAPKADHQAVVQAVEQAGLTSLMTSLPDGLDTLIGEGGRQLSGGQAQRVALARMLVDNQRDILLFDEPTAHLDVATEADLKQTMMPLFDKKLVLFATHRLHWLQQMDYVVVLDQGNIVETGEPKTLLADQHSRLNQLRAQLKGERTHAK